MKRYSIIIALLFICTAAVAQIQKPVTWSYRSKKIGKNEAMLYLKANMESNWHIYSLAIKSIPAKTSLSFIPSKDFSLIGSPIEPKPIKKYDKNLKAELTYFEKEVVFTQKIKLNKNTTVVKGALDFTVCNDKACLPAETITFSIVVK